MEKGVRRIDFIKGALRVAALLALGAVGVWRTKGRGGRDPNVCSSDGICRSCPSLQACILPQASSLKKTEATRRNYTHLD